MSQIPGTTHPIWEKLVTGQIKHKFSLFAANMAVDRASRAYASNKSAKVQLIGEIREFFNKYEGIIASELTSIA